VHRMLLRPTVNWGRLGLAVSLRGLAQLHRIVKVTAQSKQILRRSSTRVGENWLYLGRAR
jgi:hypothetical protein